MMDPISSCFAACCVGADSTTSTYFDDERTLYSNKDRSEGGSSRGRSPTRRRCTNASSDLSDENGADIAHKDSRNSENKQSDRTFRKIGQMTNNYWSRSTDVLDSASKASRSQTKRSRTPRRRDRIKNIRNTHRQHVPWSRGNFRRGRSSQDKVQNETFESEEEDNLRDLPPRSTTTFFDKKKSDTGRQISTSISRSSSRALERQNSHISRSRTNVTATSEESARITDRSVSSHRSKKGRETKNTKRLEQNYSAVDEIIAVAPKRPAKPAIESCDGRSVQRRSSLLQKIPRHLSRVRRTRTSKGASNKAE